MRIALLVGIISGALMLSACSSQSPGPVVAVPSGEIQLCDSCHYVQETSAGPEFPKIAGQYDVYLRQSVEKFKEGKRDSETMQRVASLHTEEEMKKLAHYFAMREPGDNPSIPVPDPNLWFRGKDIFERDRVYGIACANCHGYDAMGYTYQSPRMRNRRAIPRLAGQSHIYLASAIQRYVDGREQSGMCTMRKAGKTLTKNDIDSLVEYLSSLTP